MGTQNGLPERAAAYIRISSSIKQGNNHSPEVQRAAIELLAAREGYLITMGDADEERGRHTTKRPGYQRILEAARRGEVRAILVFHTSRWGRRTGEMVERLDELDRAGIAFWSVDRGRLQPGLVSTILFAVDEEFCRTLARNIRPARERGARHGVHQGPTPFGFYRRYPEWDGVGKRPAGHLIKDEATGPIVQDMFRLYDAGLHSLRTMARWLNEDVGIRAPHQERWTHASVRSVLSNVTYTGLVSHNKRPRGIYDRCGMDAYFEAQGQHEPLVSPELFARVQQRMRAMSGHPSMLRPAGPYPVGGGAKQRTAHTYLGSGLLRCHDCGGPMRPNVHPSEPGHKGTYVCRHKMQGASPCRAVGYRMDLAHAALLREVGRLRGSPWTPVAERQLSDGQESTRERVVRLEAAILQEQRRLERQAHILTMRNDAGPAEVKAFAELAQQSEGRIAGLQSQLREAERSRAPDRVPDLRALHARLTRTELWQLFRALDWQSDEQDRARVRQIALDCVQSATLAERQPAWHSTWLRFEVTWTEGVRELLDASVLRLD